MTKNHLTLVVSPKTEASLSQNPDKTAHTVIHNPDKRYMSSIAQDELVSRTGDSNTAHLGETDTSLLDETSVLNIFGHLHDTQRISTVIIGPPAIQSSASVERAHLRSAKTQKIALSIGRVVSAYSDTNIIISSFSINHDTRNATKSEIALAGAMDTVYNLLRHENTNPTSAIQRIAIDPTLLREEHASAYPQLNQAYATSIAALCRTRANNASCNFDDRQYHYNIKQS